jgi:hypothetical protein
MKSDTKLLDQMIKNLRKMQGMKVEWGFFDDEYADPRGVSKVSEVAQLVEDGHPNGGIFEGTNTPERPFFKAAANSKENQRAVSALIKKNQRKVLQGKMTTEQNLNEVGELLVRQLQDSIENFTGTPTEATIAMREKRGESSTDVLIETGTLWTGVEYQLKEVK